MIIATLLSFLCTSSLLAATTPLASADDYIFTKPSIPQLIEGKVMGEEPAYRILRVEDMSFLNEAKAEIDLCHSIPYEGDYDRYFPLPMTNDYWYNNYDDSRIIKEYSQYTSEHNWTTNYTEDAQKILGGIIFTASTGSMARVQIGVALQYGISSTRDSLCNTASE